MESPKSGVVKLKITIEYSAVAVYAGGSDFNFKKFSIEAYTLNEIGITVDYLLSTTAKYNSKVFPLFCR